MILFEMLIQRQEQMIDVTGVLCMIAGPSFFVGAYQASLPSITKP